MSTPTTKTAADAAIHLAKVQEELIKTYGGKTGYNPFLYSANVIAPLLIKLTAKEVNPKDIDAAFAIVVSNKLAKISLPEPKATGQGISGVDNAFNTTPPAKK